MKFISDAVNAIGNLLYPRKCCVCYTKIEAQSVALCIECWTGLCFITDPCCNRCGKPKSYEEQTCFCEFNKSLSAITMVVSSLQYNTMAMKIVAAFKYNEQIKLRKLIGAITFSRIRHILPEVQFLIPVPLHPKRLRERGYNQAALLAMELDVRARKCGLYQCVLENILCRTVNSVQQTKLKFEERGSNVSGIFAVNEKEYKKSNINGAVVAIIDDVITTGATVNECAKVLKALGAVRILAFSFART